MQAWQYLESGSGDRAGARARPQRQARAARRRAVRHQGHHRYLRHADRDTARRSTRATGRGATPRASRSARKAGGVLMGKTVTTEFANRHPGQDAQSVRSVAHAGRLVERLGRRGRRLHGAARDRHADHRLDDAARVVLRRVRLPPDVRRPALRRRQGSRRARSTRSGSSRARSRTSRSTATCCWAATPSRCRPTSPAPRIGFCRTHFWSARRARARRSCSRTPRAKLARAGAQGDGRRAARGIRAASRTRTARSRASSSRAISRGRSRTTGKRSARRCATAA